MPILGIFSPKTILMFRVEFKKNRVGRPTGTTHTFHLSLNKLLEKIGKKLLNLAVVFSLSISGGYAVCFLVLYLAFAVYC